MRGPTETICGNAQNVKAISRRQTEKCLSHAQLYR